MDSDSVGLGFSISNKLPGAEAADLLTTFKWRYQCLSPTTRDFDLTGLWSGPGIGGF